MSLRVSIAAIVLMGLLGLSFWLYAAEEEAKGLGMTHEELAQCIVRALGLQGDLPVSATPIDYMTYLQGKGIAPLRGWIAGAEATTDDLAVVTVEALGLLGEVEDPTSIASYMAVLAERGISLETVISVITNITVRTEITQVLIYSPIAVLYETFLTPVRAR